MEITETLLETKLNNCGLQASNLPAYNWFRLITERKNSGKNDCNKIFVDNWPDCTVFAQTHLMSCQFQIVHFINLKDLYLPSLPSIDFQDFLRFIVKNLKHTPTTVMFFDAVYEPIFNDFFKSANKVIQNETAQFYIPKEKYDQVRNSTQDLPSELEWETLKEEHVTDISKDYPLAFDEKIYLLGDSIRYMPSVCIR